MRLEHAAFKAAKRFTYIYTSNRCATHSIEYLFVSKFVRHDLLRIVYNMLRTTSHVYCTFSIHILDAHTTFDKCVVFEKKKKDEKNTIFYSRVPIS